VLPHPAQTGIDIVGLGAFALSGGLLAVRRRFDIVGIAVLATVTSVGGGIIRDVLAGHLPPTALTTTWWLAIPLAATAATFWFHRSIARMTAAVEVLDAIGLGVFCAGGTATASAAGLPPPAAVLLGTVTGVGGGILRDVLAGVTPAALSSQSRLYTIPAVTGCCLVAGAIAAGIDWPGTQITAALVIVAFRLVAIRRRWHAPSARATGGRTRGPRPRRASTGRRVGRPRP
jgi:uncharacterized membrane protein YeiH